MTSEPPPPLLVIMGVSGSGKTTVGRALSRRLTVPFADGDDFHSPANTAKMAAGVPLDDNDRDPWVRTLARWLADHEESGGVLACSALRYTYRCLFRQGASRLTFVHLNPPRDVVRVRLTARRGHFMPASLLDSQVEALEPLHPDEPGIVIEGDLLVDELVSSLLRQLPSAHGSTHDPDGVL